MAQINVMPIIEAHTLTKDQRDQLAVDAMLPQLHPKGWSALKSYLQGCLDMAEELQGKSA